MQLLAKTCLDPSRATEIFSITNLQIFSLPKVVRYRNKVDYSNLLAYLI